jgi:hypothetical protein
MSQFTRDRKMMILKLVEGDIQSPCLPVIYALERMPRREQIYTWFLKNKLTGRHLSEFFKNHDYSWLRVANFVLTKIDKQSKPIIAGKDVM